MDKFEDIIQGTTPVLVDYFATWCGPCKMMHPVLEELKRQLGDRLKILKVDIDQPGNRRNVGFYQVQSVPTLILFKGGRGNLASERSIAGTSIEANSGTVYLEQPEVGCSRLSFDLSSVFPGFAVVVFLQVAYNHSSGGGGMKEVA